MRCCLSKGCIGHKHWVQSVSMIVLLLFINSFLVSEVYGQQKNPGGEKVNVPGKGIRVTGVVTNASGETLPGVKVILKGTNTGVVTGVNGEYAINVPDNKSILSFSYLGYAKQDVAVGARTSMKITMREDQVLLNEVVSIGYGSVKKGSLSTSVSKVDGAVMEGRVFARAENALQGELAGVMVRTDTGEPGEDITIRVRGAASISASSDPLYVIDGMPASSLGGISSSDIASIEVLKDAAAAAIYGSRGSNGVVIVTTKKGKSGKIRVTANVLHGMQTLENKLDLMSATEWMEFRIKYIDRQYLDRARSRGVTTASISDNHQTRMINVGSPSATSLSNKYDHDPRWFNYVSEQTKASHTYTATDESLSILDWQDKFYQPSPVTQADLSISGGDDRATYMCSGSYLNQDGLAAGSSFLQYTARARFDAKVSKYFHFGVNLSPSYSMRDGVNASNGKDTQSHTVMSSVPVAEPGVGYGTPYASYLWSGATVSPYEQAVNNINESNLFRSRNNAYIRILPTKGLQFELSGSADFSYREQMRYIFTRYTSNWNLGEGANSTGSHTTDTKWNTLLQFVGNYDRTFGKHEVSAMLGSSMEQGSIGFRTNQVFVKPFPDDAINYSFDGGKLTASSNVVQQWTPGHLLSSFCRLQYGYDGRYFVTGSLRRDGDSVFGDDNKWGLFPAVSAAWNVSREKFFEKLHMGWLSTLKLRASYGETGNNSILNTAAYPTLTSTMYGGASGYNANTLGNPDLGWEKTTSTDLAVDLAFLRNRIQLSVDWYTKSTNNLLYQTATMGASGFNKVWGNVGKIKNEGFDVELNTVNINNKRFSWSTSFNMSYNTNKVVAIGDDNTPIYSPVGSTDITNILSVGQPVNSYYMYEAIGVWQSQKQLDDYAASIGKTSSGLLIEGKKLVPGDIRFTDVGNDGIWTKETDRKILGHPFPDFTYGMTNKITYRNFDFSMLITAQTGGMIYGNIGRAISVPGMGASINMFSEWKNAWWSEEEPGNGKVPYILGTNTGRTVINSRLLYSSDYLRIKNITLGYKIPVSRKIAQNLRVYASIENVIKWDNYYLGFSPEAANYGGSDSPGGFKSLGLDYSSYPLARTFNLGISANF